MTEVMSGPVSEFTLRPPAPALRSFVAGYSGYREAGVPPALHRGLPSPYLTVIVTLHEPLEIAQHPDPLAPPGRYDALVGGLHLAPALITHAGHQSGIQLAVSPLGARMLFGLPAGELAGMDLHADDVLGPSIGELRGRLLAAADWDERFAVLDAFLLRRVGSVRPSSPPPEVARAWDCLMRSAGTARVSTLATEVGWSERYLNRRFATEIGLSPKAAARVARFDQARRLLQRKLPGRWEDRAWPAAMVAPDTDLTVAGVAAACGYYDQAHLAREFGELAGCPPSVWLSEEFRNVQAGNEAALAR